MTTLVTFKIDPKLKKAAQKKAAGEGRSYSDILQSATRMYVEGKYKMVGFVPTEWETFTPTKSDLVKIKKARENYKKGKYFTIDQVKRELGLSH